MRKTLRSLTICLGLGTALLCQAPTNSIDFDSVDQNVNPCDDFYQFACGRWVAQNPIPGDRSRWNRFDRLMDQNLATLHEVLVRAMKDPGPDPEARKLGDDFASCMDESGIDKLGMAPLRPDLEAIDSMRSAKDLPRVLARLHSGGVSALFGFGSQPDLKNSTSNIAGTGPSGFGLPDRDYYVKDDDRFKRIRAEYLKHIERMLAMTGDPHPAESAAAAMRIETELSTASLSRVERRDPAKTYHFVDRREFEKMTSLFDWEAYWHELNAPGFDKLNVSQPDYFKAANSLLKSAPLSDWKAYLRLHAAQDRSYLLPRQFGEEAFAFFGKTLSGQPEPRPRWKRCTDFASQHLPDVISRLFVEKAFAGSSKAETLALVEQFEAEMGKDIESLAWMSATTKKRALAKLHAVTNNIGYPDHWHDYKSVEIVRGDALGNHRRAVHAEEVRDLAKIGQPVDKREWDMSSAEVNAGYYPSFNLMAFPAGILQPPFFVAGRDAVVNYGSIGAAVGHELTHGFDDQGRRFDAGGNLSDWWTPDDATGFEERVGCFDEEYSQFSPVEGARLNGRMTLGENVADNGGLRLAFRAMKANTSPEAKIGGFTADQRFFLGFAQTWCENVRPEHARMLTSVDVHSPGRFRVNGTVSNMPEFQHAFGCKVGTPMVSPHMCRVW